MVVFAGFLGVSQLSKMIGRETGSEGEQFGVPTFVWFDIVF